MTIKSFPLHDPNREWASVPSVHDQIKEYVLPAIEGVLPAHPLKLAGEVLRVRPTRSEWLFTLRATPKSDSNADQMERLLALQVTLPITQKEPQRGEMVNVVGRLEVRARERGQLDFLFVGRERIDEGKLAKRFEGQIETLDRLLDRIAEARILELTQPISQCVGVVTGSSADAMADFERGLNPPRERYVIRVKHIKVNLQSPAAIADGIHRASADDQVQVVAIVRGGGDPAGIHCFDDDKVLEAVADAVTRKFVIVGLGHAGDWSASDELAGRSEDVPQSAGTWLRNRHRTLYGRRLAEERSKQRSEPERIPLAQANGSPVSSPLVARSARVASLPPFSSPSRAAKWATACALLVAGTVGGWLAHGLSVRRGLGGGVAVAPTTSPPEIVFPRPAERERVMPTVPIPRPAAPDRLRPKRMAPARVGENSR